jgi:hypothetical protein
MCDAALAENSSERFIVKIEAYAAVPLEITDEDLAKDHRAEIRKTIEQLKTANLDEVEDGVYRSFHFDLCPGCHRRYLRNPLPAP